MDAVIRSKQHEETGKFRASKDIFKDPFQRHYIGLNRGEGRLETQSPIGRF